MDLSLFKTALLEKNTMAAVDEIFSQVREGGVQGGREGGRGMGGGEREWYGGGGREQWATVIVHVHGDGFEAANFSLKMTLSGKLCCVALPFSASLSTGMGLNF